MATAMTLYWYQLDSGVLMPTYYGQLDATVAELCAENMVTAPTAPWQNQIACSLVSTWLSQIDAAVRALCTALSVTPPAVTLPHLDAGQFEAVYWEQLDTCVRALCEAVAYEGPLDLVPGAAVAYGQRALSAAMLGQPIYTIREDGDDATQSFNSDAVTGAAPVAAITAFLDGADGFVTLWNDQSGNDKDASQATTAQQPHWTPSVVGSLPGLTFDALALQFLGTAANVTLANGAYTAFIVVKSTISGLTRFPWGINGEGGGDGAYVYMRQQSSATGDLTVEAYDGGVNIAGRIFTTTLSAAAHVYDAGWTFGSGSAYLDGAAMTLDVDNDEGGVPESISNKLAIAVSDVTEDDAAQFYLDPIIEFILYPVLLSAASRLAIRQNIAAYYGITLS